MTLYKTQKPVYVVKFELEFEQFSSEFCVMLNAYDINICDLSLNVGKNNVNFNF